MDRSRLAVVAIVVTFRRPEPLRATVESLLRQTCPPQHVVVVDNADGAEATLAPLGDSRVEIIRAGANLGFAGGLALGMARAQERADPDYYWLLDDDSPVALDSLERALRALVNLPPGAILANRGARLSLGRIRPIRSGGITEVPEIVPLILVDGALIPREAKARIGTPRSELFMMFEDYDYSLRLRKGGFTLFVALAVRSQALNLGSVGGVAPWRAYYQTRNHVHAALEQRSPILLFGALERMAKQVIWQILRGGKNRSATIRMRFRGLHDGLRGRLGKTVEPGLST